VQKVQHLDVAGVARRSCPVDEFCVVHRTTEPGVPVGGLGAL
jgi:hypothetical protein